MLALSTGVHDHRSGLQFWIVFGRLIKLVVLIRQDGDILLSLWRFGTPSVAAAEEPTSPGFVFFKAYILFFDNHVVLSMIPTLLCCRWI